MPLVGCLRIFASFHVNFYSSKKGGGLSTGNCNGLSFNESVNVTWRSSTDTSQQVYNSCLVLLKKLRKKSSSCQSSYATH